MDIGTRYLDIKRELISDGLGDDINYSQRPFASITESDFLVEVTWVALTSGFSEKTVEAHFDAIVAAFNEFSSAEDIIDHAKEYLQEALKQINHLRRC